MASIDVPHSDIGLDVDEVPGLGLLYLFASLQILFHLLLSCRQSDRSLLVLGFLPLIDLVRVIGAFVASEMMLPYERFIAMLALVVVGVLCLLPCACASMSVIITCLREFLLAIRAGLVSRCTRHDFMSSDSTGIIIDLMINLILVALLIPICTLNRSFDLFSAKQNRRLPFVHRCESAFGNPTILRIQLRDFSVQNPSARLQRS